ncbi:hypothetical protein EGW08_011372 [Elysia chlorotica]|uniref:Uncharacterized protein n=1 Tax=Elysia chlorotica TaxID=188477 RepID=A0A433TH25_ELYCH|nr:hypothetical protein EGW08_011372 [Elysia chlorotica]
MYTLIQYCIDFQNHVMFPQGLNLYHDLQQNCYMNHQKKEGRGRYIYIEKLQRRKILHQPRKRTPYHLTGLQLLELTNQNVNKRKKNNEHLKIQNVNTDKEQ